VKQKRFEKSRDWNTLRGGETRSPSGRREKRMTRKRWEGGALAKMVEENDYSSKKFRPLELTLVA
jgi:hypothetical protein